MTSLNEGILEIIRDSSSMSREDLVDSVSKLLQLAIILHRQRNGLCEYLEQIKEFDEEIDSKIFQEN
jgi:hypothetical protein